ncbi:MAG: HAD hydrolase-like protein, partial [Clostridia bacterium]|nr:HAD hydrolase-like protein [Clostridia bacterium]
MKKAIMFDLDGTLINSLPDIAAAMNRSLLKNGLMPFDENAYRYMVGDGVINLSLRVTKQCP